MLGSVKEEDKCSGASCNRLVQVEIAECEERISSVWREMVVRGGFPYGIVYGNGHLWEYLQVFDVFPELEEQMVRLCLFTQCWSI